MKLQSLQYFSHSFKLDFSHESIRLTDKTPRHLVYFGLFFSFLFIFFGFYELFSNMPEEKFILDQMPSTTTKVIYSSILSPMVFDFAIILLGLFAVFRLTISMLRYRKIIFADGKFSITYRAASGSKNTFTEKLVKYMGVGCRVEFFQCGFVTKNRYVIELIHKDYKKNIPLYISTSQKNIRKIWEQYAKTLNMPAIESTDNGVEIRQVKDLDKSIIVQHEEGLIVDSYDQYEYLPWAITYTRKRDKIVLKARKFWLDVFSIFFMTLVLIACSFLVLFDLFFVAFIVFAISTWFFCRREKLVIKKNKLVKVNKYMLFSTKENEMEKKDIKNIDVTFNPLTNRYFVAIYSDSNIIVFAKKMPLKDLRWVRKFLIHEIVRKGN